MVAKKSKSKRVSLQQKYKIQKRTKEHHKRLKKGRLNGDKKKKVADNFIPNSWPYKEDLLKEIQLAKDKMEDVKMRQKEKRHEEIVSHMSGTLCLSGCIGPWCTPCLTYFTSLTGTIVHHWSISIRPTQQ